MVTRMLRVLLLIQLFPAFLCNFKEVKLVSVVAILRDGHHAPPDPYPKDPYRNASYWPVAFGQLTDLGKLQEFQLGQWLRNRYDGFLSDQYSKKHVRVRSLRLESSLASAEASLVGLFPPRGNQVWNEDINWQPIPIHTEMDEKDLLAMNIPCHRYEYLLNTLYSSSQPFSEFDSLIWYSLLSELSGASIGDLKSSQYLYNNLLLESLYNFTLPKWTGEFFNSDLKNAAEWSYAGPCYTQDLARYKVGPLVDDILKRFAKKKTKFTMYSGNASTIANVLNSLNAFKRHIPPHAATILFELYKHGVKQFYVNVLYKHDDVLEKIVLQNCEYDCPLAKFEEILESVRLSAEDFDSECRLTFSDVYRSIPLYLQTIICWLILMLLFCCIIPCLGVWLCRRRGD